MFVLSMLVAIVGIALLTGLLVYFLYHLIRGKKNIFSYFTFVLLVFFLWVIGQQIIFPIMKFWFQ